MRGEGGNDALPAIATLLGYAGLIPFCALAVMMWIDSQRGSVYGSVLASYSLAIICFLVGVWWGLALIRRRSSTLILSNAMVIAAFLGHAMLPGGGFFLLSAVLFPATLLVERRGSLFRPQPSYYASLRLRLTVVASASLLAAWAAA